MNFKYTNYEGFSKYCLGICNNKSYVFTSDEKNELFNFRDAIIFLEDMIKHNHIELYGQLFENIIQLFINNPNNAFHSIKYMNEKLVKVKKREIDFYYFISSLKTMMNIEMQFTEDFLNNGSNELYYPGRVKSLIINKDIVYVYTLESVDKSQMDKYGVYFIYDDKGILKYIGKSTNSVIIRSFQSAKERGLLDFSKIEYRYPKTKSDVALYESYYISKYKPDKNNDMIFDDDLSVKLPDISVGYSIKRSSNNCIEKEFTYYTERVLDIEDYLNNDIVIINNEKNKKMLHNKNIYSKSEAYNEAYKECLTKAKNNNLIVLNEN